MEIVYIFLVLALIITIIKHPKDVGKGVIGILLLPFQYVWDMFMFITLPIQIIILFVEDKMKVNYLSKYLDKAKPIATYKTKSRKPISFSKFKKYIVINSISSEISLQIEEAKSTLPEIDLNKLRLTTSNTHSVIELPCIGFYGFNFLIQWLSEHFKNNDVYGFASNGRSKFLTLNDSNGENSTVGLTNTGKKFWVSLYDDLDNKQFLQLNDEINVDTTLTTDSMEQLISISSQSK